MSGRTIQRQTKTLGPSFTAVLVFFLWSTLGNSETWQSSPSPYATPVLATPPASQAFGGIHILLGQSRSTNTSAPRPSYGCGLELGFTHATSLWSRLEPSLSLTSLSLGYGNATLNIPYSALAKLGYGYSLGKGLFAVWKLGVGAGQVGYRDTWQGQQRHATKDQLATILHAAFALDLPLESEYSLVSGLQWTHYAFHLDTLRTESQGIAPIQASVLVNSLEVALGFRRFF